MDMNQRIFWQEEIEKKYNRKFIDGYIRTAILENPVMEEKIVQGVELLEQYRGQTYEYDSKNCRISQLRDINLRQLVIDIYVGIAYCQTPEMFTSVTAQLASRLKWDDKREAIQTIAEIVAVLCETDTFDITKANRQASLMVESKIPLSDELVEYCRNSQYLPPMLCEPQTLRGNYNSGYLTHDDSLILGKGNHHDGDVCLDVLNKMNKVKLRLATDFLSTVEEEPTFELDTRDKHDAWLDFKKQSYKFYTLIAKHGNEFYLTHKVDKRGRIYAAGYHISTQGTSFKKAAIELATEELIEVPNEFKLD